MNDGLERICTESTAAQFEYCTGICLEELRKISKDLIQDN
jgi:hypothetical protein